MGLLVAGTKYRGEFEERLKKLMEEIKQNDDIILVRPCTPSPGQCVRVLHAPLLLGRHALEAVSCPPFTQLALAQGDPHVSKTLSPAACAEPGTEDTERLEAVCSEICPCTLRRDAATLKNPRLKPPECARR